MLRRIVAARAIVLPVACILALAGRAWGQACEPIWHPTFGGEPGVNSPVNAMLVFDDGAGPALYVGGEFETANGVAASCIAK